MINFDKEAVRERFKAVRRKAGLTQEQYAELLGVNVGQVRRYETGLTEIPAEIYFILLAKLDVSPVWLGTGIGAAAADRRGVRATRRFVRRVRAA